MSRSGELVQLIDLFFFLLYSTFKICFLKQFGAKKEISDSCIIHSGHHSANDYLSEL